MRWLENCVAIFAIMAGQASAAPGPQVVSLSLPEDAFSLPSSVRTQSAATPSNVDQKSVSLDIDLRPLPRESIPAARLRQALTPELAQNFNLFLYVSKAAHGPFAQRMYVFRKRTNGSLALLHDWPVSTGRERVERNALGMERYTVTPPGYYELDPARLYSSYRSGSWDEPMPHAMFFDAWYKGARVGLAIHGADEGGVEDLGSRASAGCVRLSPSHAEQLFDLVTADYRGRVPRLAYDDATQSTRRDGALMRGGDGKLRFADGYRVLVIIENFSGVEVATQ